MKIARLSVACALLMAASCTGDAARPPGPVARGSVAATEKPSCPNLDTEVRRIRLGYVPGKSTDLSVIPHEPNYVGSAAMPVHSGPWDYLAEVPLVIYGRGRDFGSRVEATMADVAPTIAAMLDFRDERFRPDGKVLPEGAGLVGFAARLIVTVVWDGAGWNVLRQHQDKWPFLQRLMDRGNVYKNFTIGSSPSVTPSIHTTLGTGVFPNRSGIPGLRTIENGEYVDPFIGLSPANIAVPTLADLYDEANGNKPVTGMMAAVNWHLGMIGHGSSFPGGDADPAVLLNAAGETFSNTAIYSLPDIADPSVYERALNELDAADGKRDSEWMGHPLDEEAVAYASPAHVAYQEFLLERMIESEGFGADKVADLLYVNFKSGDDAGHRWGMTSPEVGRTIKAQDDALKRLVRYLDDRVGKGEWILFETADHGFTTYPKESGAWPIGGAELAGDINEHFDKDGDGVRIADRVSSPGVYLNRSEVDGQTTPAAIARWVADYRLVENLKAGEQLPEMYEGREQEPLFDGVMVGRRLVASSCR